VSAASTDVHLWLWAWLHLGYIPRVAETPKPDEVSLHAGTSDIALANEAERLARGNSRELVLMARQTEMSRRVIVALEKFSSSSDRWSRRMFWATWVLLVATLAIVILTIVLVVKES
jgi:hypothetical protein